MPAKARDYDTVLFRMPAELGREVRAKAQEDGRPLSWTLRDLVRAGLDEAAAPGSVRPVLLHDEARNVSRQPARRAHSAGA